MNPARFFKFEGDARYLKQYEILIFYFAASSFWHYVFSYWFNSLPNLVCLEYPVAALTILKFIKFLNIQENPFRKKNFGQPISISLIPEINFLLIILVATGLGTWALLVFCEAKFIGIAWTYKFWGLISPNEYSVIDWEPSSLIVDLICVVLVGPISEEIIFRGVILNMFLKKYSCTYSIILSSLIFSIFHIHHNFIGAFIHSIIFSIIMLRNSSIYAAMVLHGSYNLIVTLLRFLHGTSLSIDISQLDKILYWQKEILIFVVGGIFSLIYISGFLQHHVASAKFCRSYENGKT